MCIFIKYGVMGFTIEYKYILPYLRYNVNTCRNTTKYKKNDYTFDFKCNHFYTTISINICTLLIEYVHHFT